MGKKNSKVTGTDRESRASGCPLASSSLDSVIDVIQIHSGVLVYDQQ